jgi:hypothetical protein
MPSRSTGSDTGSPISPRSPVVNQTRLTALPGSIATTNDVAGTSLRNRSKTTPPLQRQKEEDPPRHRQEGSIPKPVFGTYQL